MKKLFYTGLFLVLFRFIVNAELSTNEVNKGWGQPTQGYAISISTTTNTYSACSPIRLQVILKNIGNETIPILHGNTFLFYDIKVLQPNGQLAPETLYGKWRIQGEKEATYLSSGLLKPREEVSANVLLNRLFDFSLPGTYKISVSRKIRNPKNNNEWLTIISNSIKINVGD